MLALLLALAPLAAGPAKVERAPDPEAARASFAAAVDAYRRGDHASAETLWRGLLDLPGASGIDRADVLYDLGNAAWRQERPLEAVAWYTASLWIDPRRAEAWSNLELARAQAGLEPADRGDLTSTGRRLLFALTRAESEWLALGVTALFAAALALEALRGGRAARRTVAAAAVVLLVGLAPWVAHLVRGEGPVMMVVAPEGGEVRSEPSGEGAVVGRLEPGSCVRPVDRLPGWVRAEGRESAGWVQAQALQPLTAPFSGFEGGGGLAGGGVGAQGDGGGS